MSHEPRVEHPQENCLLPRVAMVASRVVMVASRVAMVASTAPHVPVASGGSAPARREIPLEEEPFTTQESYW